MLNKLVSNLIQRAVSSNNDAPIQSVAKQPLPVYLELKLRKSREKTHEKNGAMKQQYAKACIKVIMSV
jgi:hypothetical protein